MWNGASSVSRAFLHHDIVGEADLPDADAILIASDGVFKYIDHDTMVQILADVENPQACADTERPGRSSSPTS